MTKTFNQESTSDEVLEGVDLRGRRAFVTGVSSGLGLETARALAARGAAVTGTARDTAKAERATAVVRDAARQGGGSFDVVAMDLADLASVRAVAARVVDAGEPLDLVVTNAGIMAPPFGRTRDGFELQFGTNVLGHLVLATRLAPLMRAGARLVVLSSSAHRMADVDLDDPNFDRTPYDPWGAYGASKIADALLAVAFDARHRDRGVRAASVHPGVILTELMREIEPVEFQAAFQAMSDQHVAMGNPPLAPKTVPQGAATTVWAGVVADPETIGGRFFHEKVVSVKADVAAVRARLAPPTLFFHPHSGRRRRSAVRCTSGSGGRALHAAKRPRAPQ